jgi:hypothetical protein
MIRNVLVFERNPMTLETLKTLYADGVAVAQAGAYVLSAIGVLCLAASHLPLPAKWSERFARFAAYTSQKFSVNDRKAP